MSTAVHPLVYGVGKLWRMPRAKSTAGPTPTQMGERILQFMTANNITNRAQFAETVLGISRQRFHKWLYTELKDVEAKPILLCADALNTNPEYLLGVSDDPRPAFALDYAEATLMEAFRTMSPEERDLLLETAAAWVAKSKEPANTAAPFRHAPLPPPPEKSRM